LECTRVKKIKDKYQSHDYLKKDRLYAEGQRPQFLFYLISGKVKCYKISDDGKEYITDLLIPGDFIGYTAVISEINYDDSAMVLEDAEILQIPREDFLSFIYTDSKIAGSFIKLISKRKRKRRSPA
jgi:CRP-like cAMP-binding protein